MGFNTSFDSLSLNRQTLQDGWKEDSLLESGFTLLLTEGLENKFCYYKV